LNDLTPTLITECAQLVKANSIAGCKQKTVEVVYTKASRHPPSHPPHPTGAICEPPPPHTPKWRNLMKTKSMEPGAVGFRDKTKVRKIADVEKDNSIVNSLNRSKREEFPDLAAEQEARAAEFRREQKRAKQDQDVREKEERRKGIDEKEQRSFKSLMNSDNMTTNSGNLAAASVDHSAAEAAEEDFM